MVLICAYSQICVSKFPTDIVSSKCVCIPPLSVFFVCFYKSMDTTSTILWPSTPLLCPLIGRSLLRLIVRERLVKIMKLNKLSWLSRDGMSSFGAHVLVFWHWLLYSKVSSTASGCQQDYSYTRKGGREYACVVRVMSGNQKTMATRIWIYHSQ